MARQRLCFLHPSLCWQSAALPAIQAPLLAVHRPVLPQVLERWQSASVATTQKPPLAVHAPCCLHPVEFSQVVHLPSRHMRPLLQSFEVMHLSLALELHPKTEASSTSATRSRFINQHCSGIGSSLHY